jgi:hypothetical protein
MLLQSCWKKLGRAVPLVALLSFGILTMSACSILGRGDSAPISGNEGALAGEALLICSQECADRGQCGSSEAGQMVLLNNAGPATEGHDMAVPENSGVSIERQEARTIVQVSTEEQFQMPFYLVNIPDRGQAWVAGWCIGQ